VSPADTWAHGTPRLLTPSSTQNNKRTAGIALLVLAIALGVGTGIYFYMNQGSASSNKTTTTTTPSTPATPATPISSAGGSTESSSDSTGLSAFATSCLDGHNTFRATHHADPLVWNETLADAAHVWTTHCIWEHSEGVLLEGGYGENLYAIGAESNDPVPGIKAWK
jgi:hypothetical protein